MNKKNLRPDSDPAAKVRLALIASGGGTDAQAIMNAFKSGGLPDVDLRLLISTDPQAGCLAKAEALGVPHQIIDRNYLGRDTFNEVFKRVINSGKIQLIFLVGCVVKIPILPGVRVYNIHPADPEKFGGKGMYGPEVHQAVLEDALTQIKREKKKISDRFFTHPTIHEVSEIYDEGQILLRAEIEIPIGIISDYLDRTIDCQETCRKLQDWVLPFEWLMLPTAVNMAARLISINKDLH
jgi:phosphoribosylglycinamide formyltransferase-1